MADDKTKENDLKNTSLTQHQPHSMDLEKSVLASLMSLEESFDRISDIITKYDFYAQRHQYIFDAISHLANANEPYDATMVMDWLDMQKLLEDRKSVV